MELLIKPCIYNDESIEGYIVRISQLNGYKDIDGPSKIHYYYKSNLQELRKQKVTAYFEYLPYDLAEMLTGQPFLDKRNNRKYLSFRELLLGHGRKYYPGITRYCSKCLAEKKYHRISWSIIPEVICIKHQCFLLHKCPSCSAQVNLKSLARGICAVCEKRIYEEEVPQFDQNFIEEHPILYKSISDNRIFSYYNSQELFRLRKWLMYSILNNSESMRNNQYNLDLEYLKLTNMVIVAETDIDKINQFILFTERLLLNWPLNLDEWIDNNLTWTEKQNFNQFFSTKHCGRMRIFNSLSFNTR